MTAIACGMYGLVDTGFNDVKMLAALAVGSLVLRMKADGASVDTIKANACEAVIASALVFVAFVN